MINIEATIRWKGYNPNDLSKGSHKRVWANCDICSKGRWVTFKDYRDMCYPCSTIKKRMGRPLSEETRRKISESNKGKPKNIGRKHSEETKHKIGKSNIGKHSGKPSWWKGKHLPEETKRRISETRIRRGCGVGIKHTVEHKLRTSKLNKGSNNCMFGKHHLDATKKKMTKSRIGKHHSEETKKRMSISNRGRIVTEEHKRKQSIAMTGRTASEETKRKQSKSHSGDKCHFWKGGISFDPYCQKFSRQLRKKIRDRDNHTCQLCSEKENGRRLDVHHVNHDKQNCEPQLIALCHNCHSKVNHHRDHYEEVFMNKLIERGIITKAPTTEVK